MISEEIRLNNNKKNPHDHNNVNQQGVMQRPGSPGWEWKPGMVHDHTIASEAGRGHVTGASEEGSLRACDWSFRGRKRACDWGHSVTKTNNISG